MFGYKSVQVALSLFISLFLAETGIACSCAHSPVSERFDEVDYIFTAEIFAAELLVDPNATIRSTGDKIRIKLGPRQDYKEDSSHLEFLYTKSGGSSCGVKVTIGAMHTFLVDENGFVSLCGSTIGPEERKEFYQLLVNRNLIESH